MRALLFGLGRPGLADLAVHALGSQLTAQWLVVASYQRNADKWAILDSKPKALTVKQATEQDVSATQQVIFDQVVAQTFYRRHWVQELFNQGDQYFLIDPSPWIHLSNEQLRRLTHLYVGKLAMRSKLQDFYARFLAEQKQVLTEEDFITKVSKLTDYQYYLVDRSGKLKLIEMPNAPAPAPAVPRPISVTEPLVSRPVSVAEPVASLASRHQPLVSRPEPFVEKDRPSLPDTHQEVWVSLQPNPRTVHDNKAQLLQPFAELRHMNGLVGEIDTLTRALFENVSPDELQIVIRFRKSKFDVTMVLLLAILNRYRDQKLVTTACIMMR